MSELTYGYVDVYEFSALSNAAQSGYNFILDDVLGLTRALDYNFASSPLIPQAQNRLDLRAQRLCSLSSSQPALSSQKLNVATARLAVPGATRLPVGQGPALVNHTGSFAPITSLTLWSPQAQSLVQTAAPLVRQTFDLLARAELAVARAQTIRPQTAPASASLAAVQAQLQRADQALAEGNAEAAVAAAEAIASQTAKLEAELAQAGAQHVAHARRAADALARAGSLWTVLHAEESLRQQATARHATALGVLESGLRACREAYAAGHFDEVVRDGAALETQLTQLMEAVRQDAARAAGDKTRHEVGRTLRDLGFEVRVGAHDGRGENQQGANQWTLGAWRGGRKLMTITFDGEGGFVVDTRHFAGAPTCSVETGKFLQELSRRLKFEVEERRYVPAPDSAPGQVAHTRSPRRHLALGQTVSAAPRRSCRAVVPPQALAAWARIARQGVAR